MKRAALAIAGLALVVYWTVVLMDLLKRSRVFGS